MDSDHPDFDKSLPGMGIPRWMKKTERVDYGDFCQSPPSHDDGFFHFGGQSKTAHATFTIGGPAGKPDCVFRKVDKESDSGNGPAQPGLASGNAFVKRDCKTAETTSFFKTVSTSSLLDLASSQAAILVRPTKTVPANQFDAANMSNPGRLSDSSHKSTSMDSQLNVYKGGPGISAPSALEAAFPNIKTAADYEKKYAAMSSKNLTTSSNSNHTSTDKKERKTNPGNGNGNNNVAVLNDDVTPSTTPAVTPACSPQLARRNENPFFTGSTQSQSTGKSTGSWLFRSSNPSSEPEKNRGFGNILYETRNDNQMDSSWKNTPTDNKPKTRYIPKPSQLRELNFWSPTSM